MSKLKSLIGEPCRECESGFYHPVRPKSMHLRCNNGNCLHECLSAELPQTNDIMNSGFVRRVAAVLVDQDTVLPQLKVDVSNVSNALGEIEELIDILRKGFIIMGTSNIPKDEVSGACENVTAVMFKIDQQFGNHE